MKTNYYEAVLSAETDLYVLTDVKHEMVMSLIAKHFRSAHLRRPVMDNFEAQGHDFFTAIALTDAVMNKTRANSEKNYNRKLKQINKAYDDRRAELMAERRRGHDEFLASIRAI